MMPGLPNCTAPVIRAVFTRWWAGRRYHVTRAGWPLLTRCDLVAADPPAWHGKGGCHFSSRLAVAVSLHQARFPSPMVQPALATALRLKCSYDIVRRPGRGGFKWGNASQPPRSVGQTTRVTSASALHRNQYKLFQKRFHSGWAAFHPRRPNRSSDRALRLRRHLTSHLGRDSGKIGWVDMQFRVRVSASSLPGTPMWLATQQSVKVWSLRFIPRS